jgi:DNA transformation protein
MRSPEYRAFLEDLFAGLGAVDIRPMFGVGGLFCHGTMFAVVADERIFLKTDARSRVDFEQEGMTPFVYRTRDGREIVTSYHELPARLVDEPDEAVAWARRAYEIALHSSTSLRKQRKRLTSKTARQPSRRRARS